MFLPFTCLLHCYWGIFTKFEEKGRNIISAYLAKINHNLKNKLNYWHNFRNIGALPVAYYATFSSTISKPKSKGNSEGRGGEGRGKFSSKTRHFPRGWEWFFEVFSGGSGSDWWVIKKQQLLCWASCQLFPTIFYLWTTECVLKQYQFKHTYQLPFSGSHGQLFCPYWGSSGLWFCACVRYWPYRNLVPRVRALPCPAEQE